MRPPLQLCPPAAPSLAGTRGKAPGQPGALASGPVSVARAPRPGRARRACGTAATACGATPCTRTVSTGTHVASTRAAARSGIDAGSIHASCARHISGGRHSGGRRSGGWQPGSRIIHVPVAAHAVVLHAALHRILEGGSAVGVGISGCQHACRHQSRQGQSSNLLELHGRSPVPVSPLSSGSESARGFHAGYFEKFLPSCGSVASITARRLTYAARPKGSPSAVHTLNFAGKPRSFSNFSTAHKRYAQQRTEHGRGSSSPGAH